MIIRSMLRFITIFLISIFLVLTPAEAGIISKIVKGSAIVQGSKFVAKQITKKLTKNELKVGKYGKMRAEQIKDAEAKASDLQYHHIPSAKYMERYGVKKSEGVSVGMDKTRHSITRTYKNSNKKILKDNEMPRDALARDIKDFKEKYPNVEDKNLIRDAAKEIIKQNKDSFPDLFTKVKEK